MSTSFEKVQLAIKEDLQLEGARGAKLHGRSLRHPLLYISAPFVNSAPFVKFLGSIKMYSVIYDGNCNLCVTLVRLLEQLDQGQQFEYVPMQEDLRIAQWGITPEDCEQGIILLDQAEPNRRWQGSDAAEEIGRLLPAGDVFVQAYRSLPGVKSVGDNIYAFIRDNRYSMFGKRDRTYESAYPICESDQCRS